MPPYRAPTGLMQSVANGVRWVGFDDPNHADCGFLFIQTTRKPKTNRPNQTKPNQTTVSSDKTHPKTNSSVHWGLTPQQQPGSYQGGEMMMMKSVFWWRKPEYPEESTDHRQVTDETFHTYGLCPVRGLNLGRSGVKQSELRRDDSTELPRPPQRPTCHVLFAAPCPTFYL